MQDWFVINHTIDCPFHATLAEMAKGWYVMSHDDFLV